MKKQSKILFILIALIVFGIIYLIISLTQDVGKTESTITMEKSIKELLQQQMILLQYILQQK